MSAAYRALPLLILMGAFTWHVALAQRSDPANADGQTDTSIAAVDSSVVAADSSRSMVDSVAARLEPIVLRVVPDSTAAAWRADADYAYANDSAYWKRPDRRQNTTGDWLTRVLSSGWTLVFLAGVLLYAIVRIVTQNNLQLFYRSARRRPVENTGGDVPTVEDDLEGKLQHYLQTGDYRQAVRFLYLKSLRLLNDRGLIRYHPEATNHEYWQQLGESAQAAPFRGLTRIYEKVWYGEFPLGKSVFDQVHGYFEDFYKTVRS